MTSNGLLMPSGQNASQTRSILLFSSPLITGVTLVRAWGSDWDMATSAARAFRAAFKMPDGTDRFVGHSPAVLGL